MTVARWVQALPVTQAIADFHVHAHWSPDSQISNRDRVTNMAAEGVEILVSTDHAFVTDYDMPGLNGIESTRLIRELRQDLPILLCSGFMDTDATDEANEAGVSLLLTKPIRAKHLAQTIRPVPTSWPATTRTAPPGSRSTANRSRARAPAASTAHAAAAWAMAPHAAHAHHATLTTAHAAHVAVVQDDDVAAAAKGLGTTPNGIMVRSQSRSSWNVTVPSSSASRSRNINRS